MMKPKLLWFALISALAGECCIAQNGPLAAQTNRPPVEDFKPASTNQRGKNYPQVNSERRVRARISAPQAQKVQLEINGKRFPITKDSNGAWTGDSAPFDEGNHYYGLVIAGAEVLTRTPIMRTRSFLQMIAVLSLSLLAVDMTGTWKADFDQSSLQRHPFALKQDGTNYRLRRLTQTRQRRANLVKVGA